MAKLYAIYARKRRGGFYMIYAVLLIVSIGFACMFYLYQSHHRSHTHASLHAKVQLQLYAQSLKKMVLLCLEQRDIHTCENQTFIFPPDYRFHTTLTILSNDTLLLDIYGYIAHPANGNITRLSKRYILLRP